ncbi:MAG: hypothetical protein WD049_03480, partial [Candidatus Paceibacterota bacterium]
KLWHELLGQDVRVNDTGGASFFESNEGRAHYLVGYCPINERAFSKGHAILNTLLLPGMDNTPEAAAMLAGLETHERVAYQKQAERQSMRDLNTSKDFTVIRQYHQHVSQVRMIEQDVFDYSI